MSAAGELPGEEIGAMAVGSLGIICLNMKSSFIDRR